MANDDLRRTLAAVANPMQVVAGVTSELRRSVNTDAQTLTVLHGAVDRGVQRLRGIQPTHTEDA